MPRYAVRFAEMYGDFVVEADNPREAEQIASNELMRWSGFGTDADEVRVEGLTIHTDMTEAD